MAGGGHRSAVGQSHRRSRTGRWSEWVIPSGRGGARQSEDTCTSGTRSSHVTRARSDSDEQRSNNYREDRSATGAGHPARVHLVRLVDAGGFGRPRRPRRGDHPAWQKARHPTATNGGYACRDRSPDPPAQLASTMKVEPSTERPGWGVPLQRARVRRGGSTTSDRACRAHRRPREAGPMTRSAGTGRRGRPIRTIVIYLTSGW